MLLEGRGGGLCNKKVKALSGFFLTHGRQFKLTLKADLHNILFFGRGRGLGGSRETKDNLRMC